MKSIKPGRGPSAMNFLGSIIAVIFGVFWTFMAASMGAPFFFPLFGILFIIMGIVQAVYSYKNTTGKNRYSVFDITSDDEETDPLNDLFGNKRHNAISNINDDSNFCPYCGTKANDDHKFCRKCGKALD